MIDTDNDEEMCKRFIRYYEDCVGTGLILTPDFVMNHSILSHEFECYRSGFIDGLKEAKSND